MIYINGRFLLQAQTGVNRFAYEICRIMTAKGRKIVFLCPPGRINDCYDISSFEIIHCGRSRSHLWEQIFLPAYFHKIRGEKILVCLTGIAPIATTCKIMTIHDLAFMVNPKWFSLPYRLLYKTLTPLGAITSKQVITVSNFSKSEIERLLNLPPNKISVIYNAVSSAFLTKRHLAATISCQDKYILAVSSIDPRKNFQTLLKSFALLQDKNIKLYIVGGQASIYATSIEQLCGGMPQERIKWLGRVSDEMLRFYYEHALCFVYPSLYEGFGIPPLEAMSCGTPAIVSDIPPIREVCNDAVLYADPQNAEDFASKISLLMANERLQNDLRRKGYERYKNFDWAKSEEHLYNIIQKVLNAK